MNIDLMSNYADVHEGLKDRSTTRSTASRTACRMDGDPNYQMFNTEVVPEDTDSWSVIWEDAELEKYSGKISIYGLSDFIADAAVYLKSTQPDLGIDNPYQLNEEQFDAAVDLLKKQAPHVGELGRPMRRCRSARSRTGTAWSGRRGRTSTSS